MTRIMCLGLALLAAHLGSAQQPCDRQRQSQDVAQAAKLQQELRNIPVRADEPETDIPSDAQSRLPQFKEALARVVRDTLSCHADQNPTAIQTELAQLLHANSPQPPQNSSVTNQDLGYVESLSSSYASNLLVKAEKASPDLLSIKFSFHIGCGDDTVWMLFERQQGQWAEKLLWQAPYYKQISGAFGDFFLTTILPGDKPGDWRAVAIHGIPWCTSRFSSFAIDLLAPSAMPDRPRVVWHTSRGYSRGDYESRLHASRNTFEFRTSVPAFDAMDYERPVVYRFSVDRDQVQRIGPIAVNGPGFVEEWLAAPWTESQHFSDKATMLQLQTVHTRFKHSESWNSTLGPVCACTDDSKHFQVELDDDDPPIEHPAAFYQIQENGVGYTMMVANSQKPDLHCTGPNLMKRH